MRPLVQELLRLRDLIQPPEIPGWFLDAATGQEAVNVATHFDQALNITGGDPDQAGWRRAGRRGAEFEGGDRQADQVHGDGGESGRIRAVPPGADGVAHFGHGRRGEACGRAPEAGPGRRQRMEEKDAQGPVHDGRFSGAVAGHEEARLAGKACGMLPGGAEAIKRVDMNKQEKEFKRMEGYYLRHDVSGEARPGKSSTPSAGCASPRAAASRCPMSQFAQQIQTRCSR